MRHICATLFIVLAYSAGAYADVRYTTHVEVRRLERSSPGNSQDIASAMQMLMPSGDAVTFVSANAIRIEQTRDGKKTVVLLRPEGQVILDPEARTYTRVPDLGDVLKEASAQPPPRFKRTGDFAVIHSVRVERVEVTIPVTLPVIPPPGFPTSVVMTGEMWIADAFKELWPGVQKTLGLTVRLPPGLQGIVLRQILRNREFGYEVESTVTELTEGPIDPATLTIPEGYREASRTGVR